ncbi:Probable RNA-directed DNA polymerase from transposon BS [Eumeta japonica]|uniref:Probable RNA-directed DNA polymerase from transposon BS n=1 Tax=Eumeta variegata TaxID=151549 RepID=A0A4C1UG00_EUMVA|nr:Probable RNA-directed DNA polymerase from transposon BS [Eumeta japonica]
MILENSILSSLKVIFPSTPSRSKKKRIVKAVIKEIPLEFEISNIKDDLINQGVCGLSGLVVEAPYKICMPSQCHRCGKALLLIAARNIRPTTEDDIDNAIGARTNHIRTVDDSSRTVPANSNRKELPRDVKELIRAKNAALRRASKYHTCENRSHARTLQPKVRDRMQEYISNRHSIFRLDNTYSSVRPISAGVFQSSTLSPLLYSACLNDIPEPKTGIQLALFADDTALFLRSNCLRNILPLSAVSYEPPSPHHFCRKPRNVLIDPPDNLAVEVEKLIELRLTQPLRPLKLINPVRIPRLPKSPFEVVVRAAHFT